MSKGFKICLVVLACYCVLMSPLIWQGIRDGSVAGAPLAAYLGLLGGLLASRRRNKERGADSLHLEDLRYLVPMLRWRREQRRRSTAGN